MTDWGRKIRVDGVRPAWLTDDDRLCWWSSDTYGGMTATAGKLNWQTTDGCAGNPGVKTIRLPADHWAYPALDAGFEPWPGGDNAPGDWDGGDVLLRNGSVARRSQKDDWQRGYSGDPTKYAHLDTIGYRRKSEPTLRTSDEALRRMEALVRRMATEMERRGIYDEAREIVKLLPEPPVDPDLLEARRLVADAYHQEGSHTYRETVDGTRDDAEVIEMALAGIRRGRELAAER